MQPFQDMVNDADRDEGSGCAYNNQDASPSASNSGHGPSILLGGQVNVEHTGDPNWLPGPAYDQRGRREAGEQELGAGQGCDLHGVAPLSNNANTSDDEGDASAGDSAKEHRLSTTMAAFSWSHAKGVRGPSKLGLVVATNQQHIRASVVHL